jgi:hypothetical protein
MSVHLLVIQYNTIHSDSVHTGPVRRQHQHTDCIYCTATTQDFRGADKSLARPSSRCILFDGENISFDASLVIYINSTNILPIMIINTIYEHQNLLSL